VGDVEGAKNALISFTLWATARLARVGEIAKSVSASQHTEALARLPLSAGGRKRPRWIAVEVS
jgi:hypothetical protein